MNIKLSRDKVDLELYNNTTKAMFDRVLIMEKNYEETRDRTESLENWTDIYLPLKLQH